MEDLRYPCKICGKPALASILESREGVCIRCCRTQREQRLLGESAKAGQSLYPVAALLLSNKSHEHRLRTLSCAQAIAEFYVEASLTKSDLRDRFLGNPEAFTFGYGDLNDLGEAFTRGAFNRWLENIDRWVATADRSSSGYKASLNRAYARFASKSGG